MDRRTRVNFTYVGTRQPINKICEAMGIKVYDTSMPQDFVNDVNNMWRHTTKRTDNIYGHAVWSYDIFKFAGAPVAIDELGMRMLAIYYSHGE